MHSPQVRQLRVRPVCSGHTTVPGTAAPSWGTVMARGRGSSQAPSLRRMRTRPGQSWTSWVTARPIGVSGGQWVYPKMRSPGVAASSSRQCAT
jgi:hypothetical protein